mmetsp:Transcript_38401/g.88008  ORF Transcript_38401/g.88008 Transcript_38401/m.88008 type:complete len:84 (-) Transcript_38401:123-374(-)
MDGCYPNIDCVVLSREFSSLESWRYSCQGIIECEMFLSLCSIACENGQMQATKMDLAKHTRNLLNVTPRAIARQLVMDIHLNE